MWRQIVNDPVEPGCLQVTPHIAIRHIRTDMWRDAYPFSGHVFVFRGKRGDLLKCLWWCDGGLCLLSKRLEKGRFAWPRADGGVVALTTAQLSLLLEGFDWRQPVEAARPRSAL